MDLIKNNLSPQQHPYTHSHQYQQQQQYNFRRLQQQTHRMEHMTKIIQQYSDMLQKYERDNSSLKQQNQAIKNYKHMFQALQTQNQNMKNEYENIHLKLVASQRKNQILLKELEICQKQNQIANKIAKTPTKQKHLNFHVQQEAREMKPGCLYSRRDKTTPQKDQYHIPAPIDWLPDHHISNQLANQRSHDIFQEQLLRDYSALAQMYQELKHQLYSLHRENIDLKNVISDQSKLYSQFQTHYTQKKSPEKRSPHKNKPESAHQQNQGARFSAETPLSGQVQQSTDTKSMTKLRQHNPTDIQKIRNLKKQLKKQHQLLDKFHKTEQQQFQLIEMLKSQKSKVCLCHTRAPSKKVIGSSQGSLLNTDFNGSGKFVHAEKQQNN